MSELQAQPAAQQEWRQLLSEMVDAMKRYEMDVNGEADQPARHREMMERAEALLKESQPQTAAAEGWKLVPVEPTKGMMMQAADNLCERFGSAHVETQERFAEAVYEELVTAAPEPPQPQPDWTPYLMLAEFGRKCFESITDARDVEWDTAFDIAREVGLLVPEQRNEPCEAEGACRCNDEGVEFPTTCYRPTSLVNALLWKDLTQPGATEVE